MKNNYLVQFEYYIRQNVGKNKTSIKDALIIIKCSRSTLNHYCKIKFNMTPREFLREIKKKIMIDSVKKTNRNCDANFDYTFYSSFSREFKKLTGITPNQYKSIN